MRSCLVHPEKAQFATLEEATEAASFHRWEKGTHRLFPYRCGDCGVFHLTKKKPPNALAARLDEADARYRLGKIGEL